MEYYAAKLDHKYGSTYKIIKDFHLQIKGVGWGEGCLPSKFTEDLCKAVFGFNNRKDKSHDAIANNGDKIEIKATIGNSSSTTINSSLQFDELYWLRFDFEKDIVHVKVYTKQSISNYLTSNKNLNPGRINITLSKVVSDKKDDHIIKF